MEWLYMAMLNNAPWLRSADAQQSMEEKHLTQLIQDWHFLKRRHKIYTVKTNEQQGKH